MVTFLSVCGLGGMRSVYFAYVISVRLPLVFAISILVPRFAVRVDLSFGLIILILINIYTINIQ